MSKTLEKDIELRLESMKDLALVPVVESEQISAFYMKTPGKRLMSTLLIFTPEGIVLQGDHVPEGHGVCSRPGYGLRWFTEELCAYYLCEKFLEKVFMYEYAVKCVKRRILIARRRKVLAEREARDAFDAVHQTSDWPGAEWEIFNTWKDVFGFSEPPYWYDYSPESVIGLVAIQRKFSELYRARCETEVGGYDPWNATKWAIDLEGDGVPVVQIRQGYKTMSPACKELERLVLGGYLRHNNNPVLTWAMDNVMVTTDPAGNIKPAKDKATERIDPAVALITAIATMLEFRDEPSIYESRGILTI